ncbi:hypothetical protein AG1IA_10061 [Rhizoctonia solani AG-1 IA]|uniref:Uncharacterized protein n=1 Tax=Thanatephorus cucumeris (strain AG1-IA) TaxID=983506 RepID=L8WD77_THACA|nr:hypothetical protein AG1IA_10061 [Rhizoctonia solani AG-1 IA]
MPIIGSPASVALYPYADCRITAPTALDCTVNLFTTWQFITYCAILDCNPQVSEIRRTSNWVCLTMASHIFLSAFFWSTSCITLQCPFHWLP